MKNTKTAIVLTGLLAFAACSHEPPVVELPDSTNPAAEVQNIENELKQASADQVQVLSPGNYLAAEKAMFKARESMGDEDDIRDTLHQIAVSKARLAMARDVAQVVRNNMEEVVQARQDAIQVGAHQFLPNELSEIDEDLTDVTYEVEDNDLDDVQDERKDLLAKYKELELKVIKEANLKPAKVAFERAKKADAESIAPRSFRHAEKEITDADAYINANRHSWSEIKKRSDRALASANYLNKISSSAKNSENMTAEDQEERLDSSMAHQQSQMSEKDKALQQERGARESLTAENAELMSADAFNRIFQDAQQSFTAQEAEVYEQNRNLVIRLKSLRFPSAKATLKKADFALLSKVKGVIEGFGKNTVVIEGHSDSKGSKARNQKISLARAEAVRQYFISNMEIDENSITAVGHGDAKPIASNKTKDGRAQNRRVDVIVQPQRAQAKL